MGFIGTQEETEEIIVEDPAEWDFPPAEVPEVVPELVPAAAPEE